MDNKILSDIEKRPMGNKWFEWMSVGSFLHRQFKNSNIMHVDVLCFSMFSNSDSSNNKKKMIICVHMMREGTRYFSWFILLLQNRLMCENSVRARECVCMFTVTAAIAACQQELRIDKAQTEQNRTVRCGIVQYWQQQPHRVPHSQPVSQSVSQCLSAVFVYACIRTEHTRAHIPYAMPCVRAP